jgi:hypothetical protein
MFLNFVDNSIKDNSAIYARSSKTNVIEIRIAVDESNIHQYNASHNETNRQSASSFPPIPA